MLVINEAAIAAAPRYNEAEIRFHIVDPVMRILGYPDADNAYLLLEEKLEYPYIHIGRRSKKDLPLGFADYRAGIKGARGSFVVEAKAGSVPITTKDVEQAHSYAAHAQVGANYFVLCNGSIICVYETLSGPHATPIVELHLSNINSRFHELENVLSPSSLKQNCRVAYDKKLKLVDGLGSFVRIHSGRYLLSKYEIKILSKGQDCTQLVRRSVPQFKEVEAQLELLKTAFELQVSEGTAERNDDGKIIAKVEFKGVTVHNQSAMAIMGIDKASFATADQFLSTSPQSPTIFESLTDFTVSRGTAIPQIFGSVAEMDGDIHGNMFIKAAMHYNGGVIAGEYITLSDQRVTIPGQPSFTLEMDFAGTFELKIDS